MANETTIADIVAEMRRGTKLPGYWRSCDLNKILKYHADRIEAARKLDEQLMLLIMLFAVEDYVESWASVAYKTCVHAACVRLGLEYQPNGPELQEQIEARIKAMKGATDGKSE